MRVPLEQVFEFLSLIEIYSGESCDRFRRLGADPDFELPGLPVFVVSIPVSGPKPRDRCIVGARRPFSSARSAFFPARDIVVPSATDAQTRAYILLRFQTTIAILFSRTNE